MYTDHMLGCSHLQWMIRQQEDMHVGRQRTSSLEIASS